MKPDERLDLICLKGGFDVIRARVPHDGSNVVVRTGRSRIRPVAAEIFTLEVERSWIFGHTRISRAWSPQHAWKSDGSSSSP